MPDNYVTYNENLTIRTVKTGIPVAIRWLAVAHPEGERRVLQYGTQWLEETATGGVIRTGIEWVDVPVVYSEEE